MSASRCIHNTHSTRVYKTRVPSHLKTVQTDHRYLKQGKMALKIIFAITLVIVLAEAQRPFYAGLRPIGVPAVETDLLSNRFGEDADLPIIAKGDGNLVNRLNQMPIDKQPFWYINYKAYEAQRNRPQTYPLRPNNFLNAK